ncbi:MAG TPA: peptidylprolyl isomerase, partial [Actinotalea sp.]|nr:peptidylprolyl isomerase [Actinotalea sp.]
MSTRQREREYARRRHEKWVAHQETVRARQKQRRTIALSILAGLGLVAAVALVIQATGGDDAPSDTTAEATPTPEVTREVPDPALAEARTWTAALATTA